MVRGPTSSHRDDPSIANRHNNARRLRERGVRFADPSVRVARPDSEPKVVLGDPHPTLGEGQARLVEGDQRVVLAVNLQLFGHQPRMNISACQLVCRRSERPSLRREDLRHAGLAP